MPAVIFTMADKYVLFGIALFAMVIGILFLTAQPATMPAGSFSQVPEEQITEPEANSDTSQETKPDSDNSQKARLEPSSVQVCFSNACIEAELAETPVQISQGLMFREYLGEEEGMLFVFEKEAIYSFWMKNTLIPLDIIWLSKSKKIVHIEHAIPCTTKKCRSYMPKATAMYAIEVNSGFAEKNGAKIGDTVEFEH